MSHSSNRHRNWHVPPPDWNRTPDETEYVTLDEVLTGRDVLSLITDLYGDPLPDNLDVKVLPAFWAQNNRDVADFFFEKACYLTVFGASWVISQQKCIILILYKKLLDALFYILRLICDFVCHLG